VHNPPGCELDAKGVCGTETGLFSRMNLQCRRQIMDFTANPRSGGIPISSTPEIPHDVFPGYALSDLYSTRGSEYSTGFLQSGLCETLIYQPIELDEEIPGHNGRDE